jgi:deoxyinosine 3'endonuclease (endonuclease V)
MLAAADNPAAFGACFVCFERVDGAGAAGDRGFAGAAVTYRRRLLAGVTTRPLVAEGRWPADQPGATAPLRLGGEVVGCWVRTRIGAKPVAVHAAWQTDAQAAVQVVLAATRRARTPEPLRRARTLARTRRARMRWTI